MFFIGIFFALGKFNPIYPYLFSWFPLLDMFRYPQKFFFLSAFSLVFLTAFWLKAFTASAGEGRYKLKPMLFLALVLGVALIWVAVWVRGRHAAMTFACLGALVYFCRLFYLKRMTAPQLKWAVLIMLVIDLVSSNHMLVPMIDRGFYEKEPALAAAVGKYETGYRIYSGPVLAKEIPDRSGFPGAPNLLLSHIFEKERMFPKLGTYYGFEYADGSLGVELKDNWLWSKLFNEFSPEKRLRMLARSNVKYWITLEDEAPSPGAGHPPFLKKVKVLDAALPRAFIVNKTRQDHEAYKNYYDKNFDPLSEVLLYKPLRLDYRENFVGQVKEISYGPNKVTVHSRQNGDGILVLLDSYFPGWRVKVDGKETKLMRANYFYFEPVGFRAGLAISAVTFILIIVCAVWSFFQRRKMDRLNNL